jgi:ferredoxin
MNQASDTLTCFKATLRDQGWQFNAPSDLSLLEAALAAGIQLPSSCRNGSCRTCLCQLINGQVKYRIDWPGLSREEKADGCILPCVALPLTDVLIEVKNVDRKNE